MPKTCLLLPHGLYSLVPAVLTTMGWIAALFEDGCNYAKLVATEDADKNSTTNNIVQELAIADDTPYIEVGLQAYRLPVYSTQTEDWMVQYSGQCVDYPSTLVKIDVYWNIAKACSFISLVLGGGATFYLWISTCCRFSRGSWRWAGYEVGLAFVFQAVSFIWFMTDLCTSKQNNGAKCELFYGSQSDIIATIFWFIAALLIFGHYPIPREMGDNNEDGIEMEEEETAGGTNEAELAGRNAAQLDNDQLVFTYTPTEDGDSSRQSSSEQKKAQIADEEMAAGEETRQDNGSNGGGNRTKKDLSDVELT